MAYGYELSQSLFGYILKLLYAPSRKKRVRMSDDEDLVPPARRGRGCCRVPMCDQGEPKRLSLYCPGCRKWYHLKCFFDEHVVRLKK